MFNTFIPLHFYLCISCWLMRQGIKVAHAAAARITERELCGEQKTAQNLEQHNWRMHLSLSLLWINALWLWNWNTSRAHIILKGYEMIISASWALDATFPARRAAYSKTCCMFISCFVVRCPRDYDYYFGLAGRRVLMQIVLYTSDHNMSIRTLREFNCIFSCSLGH